MYLIFVRSRSYNKKEVKTVGKCIITHVNTVMSYLLLLIMSYKQDLQCLKKSNPRTSRQKKNQLNINWYT